MNVGILTFHFVPNQGALLQCWAMQKFLETEGHAVQVVDYRPAYHAVRYAPFKNPAIYARWFYRKYARKSLPVRLSVFARAFVRALAMNAEGTDRRVAAAFRSFSDRHLHLTAPYPSLAALRRNPPSLDACLAGSDQLWNPELLDHDFDPAYFLDFGPDSLIRFSYAVSLGKPPSDMQLCQLGPLCERLDAVPFRPSKKPWAAPSTSVSTPRSCWTRRIMPAWNPRASSRATTSSSTGSKPRPASKKPWPESAAATLPAASSTAPPTA